MLFSNLHGFIQNIQFSERNLLFYPLLHFFHKKTMNSTSIFAVFHGEKYGSINKSIE